MPHPSSTRRIRFILALAALAVSGPLASAADSVRSFHIPALYHVGFWVRDIAKARAFYMGYLGFEEPYSLNYPDGTLQMAVMKVNERQVIYLFPNAAKILPSGDNLDHLGLETDNIAAMREYLLAQGLKVGDVHRGRIGDLILGVKDPDGHTYEVTQLEPVGQLLQHQGKGLPPTRISNHLLSASLSVADPAASVHFYRDILGFKLISGGPKASPAAPIRLQVPDGTDCVLLLPYELKPGATPARAVPEYRLAVADAAKAAAALTSRSAAGGFAAPSPVAPGLDGHPETSCVDPDGTRVILSGSE